MPKAGRLCMWKVGGCVMNGCIDGQDKSMDGCMHAWVHGWIHGWVTECGNKQMNKWIDAWDAFIEEWMHACMVSSQI